MLIATTELIIEKYQKATDFKTVIRAGSSGNFGIVFNHEIFFIKKKTTKGAAKTMNRYY